MPSSTTILVIEPTIAIAEVLVEILADAGYLAHAVYDGAHALPFLAEARPSLILLDTKVYGPGNASLLVDLCQPDLIDVPILLLSTDAREAEALLGHRVQEYILKPFEIDVLLAGVALMCAAGTCTRAASV